MNGVFQGFRILRKHDTKVMYVAVPDVKAWFERLRRDCHTVGEEAFWEQAIIKLDAMLYEGLEHDI